MRVMLAIDWRDQSDYYSIWRCDGTNSETKVATVWISRSS